MFRMMREHVIVELGLDNYSNMFFYPTACTMRRKGGEKILCKICPGDGGWTCSRSDFWEDVMVTLEDKGVWVVLCGV